MNFISLLFGNTIQSAQWPPTWSGSPFPDSHYTSFIPHSIQTKLTSLTLSQTTRIGLLQRCSPSHSLWRKHCFPVSFLPPSLQVTLTVAYFQLLYFKMSLKLDSHCPHLVFCVPLSCTRLLDSRIPPHMLYLLLIYWVSLRSSCRDYKFHEVSSVACSLVNAQCLEQGLAHGKKQINICKINEWDEHNRNYKIFRAKWLKYQSIT